VRHIGRVESSLGLGWYYRIPNKKSVHQCPAWGTRFERITLDVVTKTYEMLWDCGYCATRALLGKSHRFCPSCGAPQDPTKRYFRAEADKVAVEDQVYVGAGLVCANGRAPSAADAAHCPTCGAALGDGDAEATLVDARPKDTVDNADYVQVVPANAASGTKLRFALMAVAAVVVVAVLVAGFWTKSAEYMLDGHTWERIIDIERYRASAGGAWCEQRPGHA
jgi:hypothetical protein